MVVMYACAVTCGRSFTVSSVSGVLISFLECFSVFSHPPLPFYYFTLLLLLSLLFLLLFVITVIIISTFARKTKVSSCKVALES